jgi:hypothetical protein
MSYTHPGRNYFTPKTKVCQAPKSLFVKKPKRPLQEGTKGLKTEPATSQESCSHDQPNSPRKQAQSLPQSVWEKGKRKGAHECALPDGDPPYPFSSNPSFFSSSLAQWAKPAALAES